MQQDKTVYLNIGKNIRKYRLQKGLTQEKLSELICANDKFVGHVERAERVPSIKRILSKFQTKYNSARAFFVSPVFLFLKNLSSKNPIHKHYCLKTL